MVTMKEKSIIDKPKIVNEKSKHSTRVSNEDYSIVGKRKGL
jgi:hypothetical protein